MFFKRSILTVFVPLLLIGGMVAACGTSTSTGTGSGTTPTTAPTTAATPTTAPSAAAVVKTASIGGKTVLTNAQGMTLYYYKPDGPTSVTCTGGCATNWPPLLFSGSGTPTSATTLPGTLSVYQGADGAQVEYQGHPLYTFIGDKSPGQTNGEGKGGNWFYATTDLSQNTGGGGGY